MASRNWQSSGGYPAETTLVGCSEFEAKRSTPCGAIGAQFLLCENLESPHSTLITASLAESLENVAKAFFQCRR
jgi:hypothetical protein